MELLSGDALSLTDNTNTSITFLDDDNDVKIAEVELLEAVVVFRDLFDWHEKLGQHFRCDDGGLLRKKPFADLFISLLMNNAFELAIERLLKLLSTKIVAEVFCSFIIEIFKILFLCLR